MRNININYSAIAEVISDTINNVNLINDNDAGINARIELDKDIKGRKMMRLVFPMEEINAYNNRVADNDFDIDLDRFEGAFDVDELREYLGIDNKIEDYGDSIDVILYDEYGMYMIENEVA